jgi:branched-chain amino acid transport system substrate-binding protein
LGLVALGGCSSRDKGEPIWLGHLAPLRGSARLEGEEAIQAIQLTMDKARDDGWAVGGRSLGVLHADSSADARAEAVRLLAVNGVVGLILGPGLANPEEVAAAARSHQAAVVLLDEVASPPTGPAVVLLGPDPARRGRALARYARKHLKKTRAAILVDRRDRLCAPLALAFADAWRKDGGQAAEWQVEGASKGQALRSGVEAFTPDVVLAAVPSSRLGELAGLLPAVPILYGGPDESEENLARRSAALPQRSEILTATVFSATAPLSEEGKDWRKRWEKSQRRPPDRTAVLARDGVQLMMTALERAKSGTRKRLREELPRIEEFESVTGKVTWVDGMAVRPLFLVRWQEGKPRLLRTATDEEK